MSNPFAKVNIIPIIRSYISTFKLYQDNTYSKGSLLLFFLFPLFAGILLPVLGITVNSNLSTLLLGLYSIFAGLFFSFQIFIFEIISRIIELNLTLQSSRLRINKFEYIAYSISFSILICFAGFLVLLLLGIFGFNKSTELILSGVSFYLLTLFILSLLMALKGIHILLSEEISIQRMAVEEKFSQKSNINQ
jgi:hypothetical protein